MILIHLDESFEYLTENDLGPFAEDQDDRLKSIMASIETMTIDYSVRNIIPEEVPASANCYLWNVT